MKSSRPGDDADRQSAAARFAKRREIRRDAEIFLTAAISEAEAGNHLVESEQHVALAANLLERFEIVADFAFADSNAAPAR